MAEPEKRSAPRKLGAAKLFEFAVKSLAARSQSSGELRAKLARRAEQAEDVEPLIVRLREYGYLNDAKFAETYATARLNNQGFGKFRVVQELRRRRVAPSVAEKATTDAYAEIGETELIEQFIRRKYRSADRETFFTEDRELASAYRRLRNAGFSSGLIVRVLKRFAKHPDLLDLIEEEPLGPREGL